MAGKRFKDTEKKLNIKKVLLILMIPVIIAIFCNFHSIVFLLPYSFPPAEAPPNPRPSPPPFGD